MKRRDVLLYGQSNKQGSFLMANKQEMQEFFKTWPEKFFTLKIEVHKNQPLSIPLIVYYKKKVVPDMQRAFFDAGDRYTAEETDLVLRSASPICKKEDYNFEEKKWESVIIELEDMDNQQLVFFIEQLKDFAAVNFGVYIEDPNSLINK